MATLRGNIPPVTNGQINAALRQIESISPEDANACSADLERAGTQESRQAIARDIIRYAEQLTADATPRQQPVKRAARQQKLKQARSGSLLDLFAPEWGLKAADWIGEQREQGWHTIALVIGLITVVAGLILLIGGWYTSIQGVRVPLALFGVPVMTVGIPMAWWWFFPALNTVVQIVGKHWLFIKPVWRFSMLFDGTTTALFVYWGIERALITYGHEVIVVMFTQSWFGVVFVASLIGLLIAKYAEDLLLAGLCILRAALRRTA